MFTGVVFRMLSATTPVLAFGLECKDEKTKKAAYNVLYRAWTGKAWQSSWSPTTLTAVGQAREHG